MGAEQSTPVEVVAATPSAAQKLCLIPPIIRRRRVRPICANEFTYFGHPTSELLNDWLIDQSSVTADMIIKPQFHSQAYDPFSADAIPEITAFMRGSTTPFGEGEVIDPAELKKSAVGMMALEARWKEHIRAMVNMSGTDSSRPVVYFGLGREDIKGTSFYASIDPRRGVARCDFGATQATSYGTLGFSGSVVEKVVRPRLGAWVAVRPIAELSIGANFNLEPSDRGYTTNTDVAVNLRDSSATIQDRPAYEMTLIAKNNASSLLLSYFQHFVTRREIMNPAEEDHITHITNYIDVGAEVEVDAKSMKFGIGGSWQLNKNNLIKGRLSHNSAQASYVFKSWAHPSLTVALTTGRNFHTSKPIYGLSITSEASLGQAEFDRASEDYEDVHVVRYGAESAPKTYKRYAWMSDDGAINQSLPLTSTAVQPTESADKPL